MKVYNRQQHATYDDFKECSPYINQSEHLKFCSRYAISHGLVLEFGVYQAKTLNLISKRFNKDIVFGFDSFEGLPEDWKGTENEILRKGTFSVSKLPKVRKNVRLIKGWFNETLPKFLETEPEPIIKFLHIDCDLYSSASCVLSLLNKRIVPGTIIVFDELANWIEKSRYSNYKDGEWKALEEWVNKYNRSYTILGRGKHCQASIVVR